MKIKITRKDGLAIIGKKICSLRAFKSAIPKN